ncbi:hypothetical protein EIY87_39410 [Amycolatopsis eburnea]|uniref:Uncharacterized protein n=1 Tax=Amycolatopsis eburnea TaxID=2267691 RepID=A0A3R9EK92_9PSEU|nr:hypothetical protein EIY87_39410 [Amycolatopsis eburnea]
MAFGASNAPNATLGALDATNATLGRLKPGKRKSRFRSAKAGGNLRAEAGVRGRYGGRLAAKGSTRLQPDWFSVKARGEARGLLRTDTPYNALRHAVFPRPSRRDGAHPAAFGVARTPVCRYRSPVGSV